MSKTSTSQTSKVPATIEEWLQRRPVDWIKLDSNEDDEKGGVGSGFFGHEGRPGFVGGSAPVGGGGGTSAQSESPALAGLRPLLKRLADPDSGFTYSVNLAKEPTTGYVVSPHLDRERLIEAKDLQLTNLVDYIEDNADLLRRKEKFLGGWHNPDSGKIVLDVVEVVADKSKAESMAVAHQQDAFYDLERGETIYTAQGLAKRERKGGETMNNKKSKLVLTTSSLGDDQLPTLEDLIKFFEKLTGRTPSPEDVAAARKRLEERRQK